MNTIQGPLSADQYAFLKARLSAPSDAAALSSLGLTKEKLRQWKRSPRFRDLLQLVRADQVAAVRVLALSLNWLYLDALEWLFRSEKVAGVKAAVEAYHTLLRMEGPGGGSEDTVKNVFNILQLRGVLPPALLAGRVVEEVERE